MAGEWVNRGYTDLRTRGRARHFQQRQPRGLIEHVVVDRDAFEAIGFGLRGQGGGPLSISQVTSGGIAEAAGLKAGDVIVKVNGRAMDAIDQAELGAIMQTSPITLTVERDGEEMDIELKRPD